ncbi:MAG TPA: NAD(+) diphosphatase [Thermoleophilaceae bacterium]
MRTVRGVAAGLNTFAGVRLDRAGPRRTDERWLTERLADRSSRALLVAQEGVYVNGHSRPALVPLPAGGEPVLLGLDAHGAVFAVDAEGVEPPDGAQLMGLRDVGALFSPEDAGLLAYATAMVNWHRRHPHCAVCGALTHMEEAGFLRRCPNCGAEHHPRTDPVVIMLVHDGDRALLGRQPTWPAGRYSALAGFVEPGESLEEAVAREVLEETSVQVEDVRYRSSQPWPFPASLMLGFHARYAGGDAAVGDGELDDVRWFERSELEATARGETDFHLPPPLAIARRLIDEWLSR